MSDTRPAQLDDALLQRRLVQTGLYAQVLRVDSTGSTNDDLLHAAAEPDAHRRWPNMTVITAEEQTGGRGRQARVWSSPAGSSLSTSLLLRPDIPVTQRYWITLCIGVALVRVLRDRDIPAALKWPNDVHVEGKKIAGILSAIPPQDPAALVVGCGINVLLTEDHLPTENSTSVILELSRAGQEPPMPGTAAGAHLRSTLLCDWLEEAAALLQTIQQHGSVEPVREQIISTISTIGQQVRVELPGGTAVRGEAVGVEYDGALTVNVRMRRRTVLDPDAGGGADDLWVDEPTLRRESFHAGDVVHLRPVGGPA